MAKKPAQTISLLTVIDSLKMQNDAVNLLISTVDAVLAVDDAMTDASKKTLREALGRCREMMWP